ncbi:MAG: hypothetical protein U0704_16590 [Candidatus Eisenbacteria bacterium]
MPRALAALMLVATLVLGAAGHLWHHIEDPHCGEAGETRGGEHFCGVCTNLHGGTLAAGDAPEPEPVLATWTEFVVPESLAPEAAPAFAGSPRAPPAA